MDNKIELEATMPMLPPPQLRPNASRLVPWGMKARLREELANIKARIRFISFEPLLGSIGMSDHMSMEGIIDWVIIGGQTKPAVYPRVEWVREIVVVADKAGVKVFLKNNLKPLLPAIAPFVTNPLRDLEFSLRQEMPV